MTQALEFIASFLGGGLFVVLVFIFTFYGKMREVEIQMKNLNEAFRTHVAQTPPTCPMHMEMATGSIRRETLINDMREDITSLQHRVDRLENVAD